jgi:predicted transcriptional regulator
MNSTTMTIRVPVAVHEKLARLSKCTRRSRSYLAAEAVSAYVDRELSINDAQRLRIDGANRC